MEITLRNGEKIKLEWNLIVLEYLEEYEGGLEELKKDIESKEYRFRAFNFVVYCLISAVYKEELSYKEAISLVNINDYDKITTVIVQNVNNIKSTDINKKNIAYLKSEKIDRKKHIR